MVTFSMTLTDPWPDFQGHDIFEVECLKNGASCGQSYYRTLKKIVSSILNGTTFN